MKVRKREYPSGRTGWQIDVSGVTEDGKPFRRQLQAPESVTSKSGAQRWGEEQRRRLERGEEPATTRAAKKAAREEAQREEAEAEAEARAGATLTQAVAWYVEDGKIDRLAESTCDLRKRLCEDHICSVLGSERQVQSLTKSDLATLAEHLAPVSAGFARLIMRVFRAMLVSARARGAVADLEVRLPKVSKTKEARAWDAGSFEAMVVAASKISPAHLAVVLLSGEAALRRGEMLGLTVGHARRAVSGSLLIERQVVRVRGKDLVRPPKGGKSRTVPLSPRCVAVLQVVASDRSADERLLLTARGDQPATENTIRAFIYRVLRHCGLPEVGAHAARHTALTHMLAAGVDLRTVQEIAGHEMIETTAGYLHVLQELLAQAGSKVANWRQAAAVTSVQLAPKPRGRVRLKDKRVA